MWRQEEEEKFEIFLSIEEYQKTPEDRTADTSENFRGSDCRYDRAQLFQFPMNNKEASSLGIRNGGRSSYFDNRYVGGLVGMRADSAEEKFEFFKQDFLADFDCFPVGFSAVFSGFTGLKLAPSSNAVACKMQRFGESIHFQKWCSFHTRGRNEACGQALESLSSREQG